MKYIRECPDCGKKIRFPLDKGRIRIHCSCGYTAIIDPDDTALYETGSFDLKPDNTKRKNRLTDMLSGFFIGLDRKRIINSLLDLKYKIQNFRYMPDRERYRFIAAAAGITALIAFMFIIC